MKRILGVAAIVTLAAGVALVAPANASAVTSDVVTSPEFYKVAYGDSITHVRSTFGGNGTVVGRTDNPGTAWDGLTIEFPTAYENGVVDVHFSRLSSGRWYLDTKRAWWGSPVRRTENTATESEFYKVEPGNTISHARTTFGSDGTIVEYQDSAGTSIDMVTVAWPTPSLEGELSVEFLRTSKGVWKVRTRSVSWGVDVRRTADTAAETEADRIAPGNSLDYVRRTFGTAGTVLAYTDESGTSYDGLLVGWPTSSPDGQVSVHFDRRPSGEWRVDDLDDTAAGWN